MTRVSYSEKTMQSEEARYPAPSGRFFLLLLLMGGVVGLVLLVLRAPFWAFYVAPLAMAPLVILELRTLDAAREAKPRVGEALRASWLANFLSKPLVDEYRSLDGSLLLWVLCGVIAVAVAGLPLSLIDVSHPLAWGGLLVVVGLLVVGLFRFALSELFPRRLALTVRERRRLADAHLDKASVEALAVQQLRNLEARARKADASPGEVKPLSEKIESGSKSRSRRTSPAMRGEKSDASRGKFKSKRADAGHSSLRTGRGGRRRAKARVEPDELGQWVVFIGKTRHFGIYDTRLQALRAAEIYLIQRGGGALLSRSSDDSKAGYVRIQVPPSNRRLQELMDQVELEKARDTRP
ncbi:MAG TPA: hypothetical protein VII45_07235 [Solirubrobacterales bacterium]